MKAGLLHHPADRGRSNRPAQPRSRMKSGEIISVLCSTLIAAGFYSNMSNASPPTCVFVKVLRDGNVLHATAMVAIDGLPAPCTCSMLRAAVPWRSPSGRHRHRQGLLRSEFPVNWTERRYPRLRHPLSRQHRLPLGRLHHHITTSIPTTTPTPPVNAFARLFAGAQNAFALLLPGAGAGARARAALAGSAGTRPPAVIRITYTYR